MLHIQKFQFLYILVVVHKALYGLVAMRSPGQPRGLAQSLGGESMAPAASYFPEPLAKLGVGAPAH